MRKASLLLLLAIVFLSLPPDVKNARAEVEVNDDGRELIAEAAGQFGEEMSDRPVVTDRRYLDYLRKIVKRLQKSDKPPNGVVPRINVLDSSEPLIYSYTDGNIVLSTTTVLAADNEAQLAAILSHEVAHITEGHYILLYQKIKAAERKSRYLATTGAIFGAILDSAVDYTVDVEIAKETDRVMRGESSYLEAMKSTAKISAAQSTYYGVTDAIANIPDEDTNGNQIDPRQRFEIAADAQGIVLLARAGYDANEAPKGWKNVRMLKNKQARAEDEAFGDMAEQMRQMQAMANMMQAQAGKALGKSGLTRTIGDIPPSRPELLGQYVNLQEVKDAGKGEKGEKPFRDFVAKILIPRAEQNLADERYDEAGNDYRNLYRKGFDSPEVLYGLARSSLGDFAFSASEKEKREAEKLYQTAVGKRPKYAAAWKALGELYDDWERYDDAVNAYDRYLKVAPNAKDSKKIERKIKSLKRKADF